MQLIDKKELKKAIRTFEKEVRGSNYFDENDLTMAFADGVSAVIDLIEYELTVVEERKRGHWVSLEPEIGLYSCSECEHMILKAKCNYCPNCGAKMEVKE